MAGLAHMEARNHIEQISKKFEVAQGDVPKLLRNIVRDGHVVSNKVKDVNGRRGYERVYEYNGEHILLAGIGLNGFIVSAYPVKRGKAE